MVQFSVSSQDPTVGNSSVPKYNMVAAHSEVPQQLAEVEFNNTRNSNKINFNLYPVRHCTHWRKHYFTLHFITGTKNQSISKGKRKDQF